MRATKLRPASREITTFSATDLTLTEGGEPTVQDLVLAERLGFVQTRDIRKLIERNREEIEAFGGLRHRGANPGKAGGRPGREFFLNRQQALLITILSKTSIAAQVRRQMIEVFDAALRGTPKFARLGRDADLFVEDDETLSISRRQLCDATMAIWQSIPSIVESVLAERDRGAPELPKKPANPALSALRSAAGRKGGLKRQANHRAAVAARATAEPSERPVGAGVPPRAPAPSADAPPLLYGAPAIAGYLGLGKRQARHLAVTGRLPTFKLGKRVCCTREALDAWIASKVSARSGTPQEERSGATVSA